LLIIFSRAVSALQMQYVSEFTFNPNSWLSETIRKNLLSFREERMFEIFKIPLAMIASIAFGQHIIGKLKEKSPSTKYLTTSGLISLILISGTASTSLGFTYYYNSIQTNQLTSSELEIIRSLQNNVYTTGKAIIIAPQTPTSYLDFTGATAIVTESPAAWQSRSPELPLSVTRFSKTVPTYIYIHKTRDRNKLSEYSGNYLEHLSNTAQVYLENQEVQIRTINNWSIPTPQSSTALIIPYDESTMSILEPFYQETYKQCTVLALFFEEKMQYMNLYQEPISYNNIEIKNGVATFNGATSYVRINGTEKNFERISVEFEFQPLNLTRNQIIIGKFDWGTTPRQMSWDIAQFGRRIVFKISPDGNNEEVLSTGEILALNTWYTVRVEYDGAHMKIFVNNKLIALKEYQGIIFKSNVDLTIGCELFNNKPTNFANMILKYVRVLNDTPPATETIFYAYDFLSSTGFNYTTVLSKDNARNSYQTQVLPYDDIITYKLLTQLETNQKVIDTNYLVILNTNGYGPLLSLFGNISSDSFLANGIFSDEYFTIQPPIKVPVITINNNTKVKAQYVNNAFSSPLIMITTRKQFTLIYVNIYPLIQQNQVFNQRLTRSLTGIMSNYIETYDETVKSRWFYEPSMLFKGFKASGIIQVGSTSIASIKIQGNSIVKMNSETYYNMSTLKIEGYKAIQIQSTEMTIQKGYGFYSTLIAYNPSITLQNNQTISIDIMGNATFLIKQPQMVINGEIQFENFYMLHPSPFYTDGRTTTLSGNVTLHIQLSDEYIIALPYNFNSPITVRYVEPLMEFNENTSVILMIPYIILIIIFVATILLIQHSKLTSAQEIKNGTNKITNIKKHNDIGIT